MDPTELDDMKILLGATEEKLQEIRNDYEYIRERFNLAIESKKTINGLTAKNAISLDDSSDEEEINVVRKTFKDVRKRLECDQLQASIRYIEEMGNSLKFSKEQVFLTDRQNRIIVGYDVLKDLLGGDNETETLRPAPSLFLDNDCISIDDSSEQFSSSNSSGEKIINDNESVKKLSRKRDASSVEIICLDDDESNISSHEDSIDVVDTEDSKPSENSISYPSTRFEKYVGCIRSHENINIESEYKNHQAQCLTTSTNVASIQKWGCDYCNTAFVNMDQCYEHEQKCKVRLKKDVRLDQINPKVGRPKRADVSDTSKIKLDQKKIENGRGSPDNYIEGNDSIANNDRKPSATSKECQEKYINVSNQIDSTEQVAKPLIEILELESSSSTQVEEIESHDACDNQHASTIRTIEENSNKPTDSFGNAKNTASPTVSKKRHSTVLSRSKFVYRERIRVDHPVFCLTFSEIHYKNDAKHIKLVAACGQRRVEILEEECMKIVQKSPSHQTKLVSVMVFVDMDPKEEFNVCVFAGRSELASQFSDKKKQFNRKSVRASLDVHNNSKKNIFDGPQFLCVGGLSGSIKVLDIDQKRLCQSLIGHTGEILDLKVSPISEWLLLSSSKDETLRLWNLNTESCFAILGGHNGHRGSVNTTAWHGTGTLIASGGMDTKIKIWNVRDGSLLNKAIKKSNEISELLRNSNIVGFLEPVTDHFPIFSTDKVHCDYVDCVEFWGDLIISKSCDHRIVLWSAVYGQDLTKLGTVKCPPPSEVIGLRSFCLYDEKVWYMRFATHSKSKMLAVGNTTGDIFLWDIESPIHNPRKLVSRHNSTIRSLVFSPEGTVLLASADDGSICFWDVL